MDKKETNLFNQTISPTSKIKIADDDLLKEYITKDLASTDSLMVNFESQWQHGKLLNQFLASIADGDIYSVTQHFKNGITIKDIKYDRIIDHIINYYSNTDIAMLELCIHHGLDVYSNDGLIILKAIEKNNLPVLKYLFTNFPTLNIKKDSFLLIASDYGFTDLVRYFIEQGADIHTANENNATPLFNIVIADNLELTQFFIAYSFEHSTPTQYKEDVQMVKNYGNSDIIDWIEHWLNSQQLSCRLENELKENEFNITQQSIHSPYFKNSEHNKMNRKNKI